MKVKTVNIFIPAIFLILIIICIIAGIMAWSFHPYAFLAMALFFMSFVYELWTN